MENILGKFLKYLYFNYLSSVFINIFGLTKNRGKTVQASDCSGSLYM